MSTFVLNLGHITCTRTAHAAAQQTPTHNRSTTRCLQRHRIGERGELNAHDISANDGAVNTAERILTAYQSNDVGRDITDARRTSTIARWATDH